MRDVTRFTVVFPTRLMAASYDEKKAIMDALRREYPHYEFDALEAFEGGMADDDDFSIIPVIGTAEEGDDIDAVTMHRLLDPLIVPDLLQAVGRAEQEMEQLY
ncbi:hypothetical protein [Devosia sp. 2618]|uniref:hypothetical protein n=1 Tax=Devosia sp. 2618 TaxID=3156454 RepID=UPI00339219CC